MLWKISSISQLWSTPWWSYSDDAAVSRKWLRVTCCADEHKIFSSPQKPSILSRLLLTHLVYQHEGRHAALNSADSVCVVTTSSRDSLLILTFISCPASASVCFWWLCVSSSNEAQSANSHKPFICRTFKALTYFFIEQGFVCSSSSSSAYPSSFINPPRLPSTNWRWLYWQAGSPLHFPLFFFPLSSLCRGFVALCSSCSQHCSWCWQTTLFLKRMIEPYFLAKLKH